MAGVRYLGVFLVVVITALGASFLSVDQPTDGPPLLWPEQGTPAAVPTDEAAEQTPSEPDEPTPTAGPTATPTPPEPTTIRVAFSGEILSHGPVITQAQSDGSPRRPYDYRPMFRLVRPIFEGVDFAVCHVETPISPDNTALSGYPIFNAPREMAEGIAASGYDACSTASNHSFDKGVDGVISTIDRLEDAGLGWAGMARSAEEAAEPVLYRVGDLTIGHLSYTYGLNGFVLPPDQPWLVDVTDVDRVLADAKATREAGADIVVLSIQWGNEYQVDPSEIQQEQARRFLRSPNIDLIIGAHVHVVQPVDRIRGEWVVYGLGNFLSNQSVECCPAASQNGIIAVAEITGTDADGWEVTGLSFLPTRVDRSDYTIVPLPQALDDPDLDDATRALYEEVVASTTEVVNRLGADLEIYDPGSPVRD